MCGGTGLGPHSPWVQRPEPQVEAGPLDVSRESQAGTFPPRTLLQTLQKWEQPSGAETSQTYPVPSAAESMDFIILLL